MISLGALASVAALALGAQQRPQSTPPEPTSQDDPAAETLAALIEEAEDNNPEITAAMRSAEAAAARVPQAGALPDPILGVAMMNLPVADPSLSREMMTMTTLQITERFPFPGKRGLRAGRAGFLAEAAEWEVERTRREVIEGVKSAYYQVYFIDRALDVTERNEALLGDFASLTSVKYGLGSVAQPDVLKAQVERTGLVDEMVALRERRSSAVARLNTLLDRPLHTPLSAAELPVSVRAAALEGGGRALTFAAVSLSGLSLASGRGPAPGIPPVEELLRVAAESNPRIRTHALFVRAQNEMLSLAEKAGLPDFNVAVAYSRRSGFSDFLSVSVSVPLPVFSGRKQDQGVLEETSVLERLRARLRAVENEVNEEIVSLVAALARARDQLMLLEDGILPQAQTSLSSATASYRVGSVDFLTLLDAQVTLYRHELEYHRLLADFAQSVASVERAVGTEVLR
jgi:outer membrane protein, heavy metal efflux system